MCIVVAAEAQHVRVINKDNLWFPIPRKVLNSKRSFSTVSFSQHTMISLMIRPALNQTLSWRPVKHSKPMYNVARIEGMGTLPAPRRRPAAQAGRRKRDGGIRQGKCTMPPATARPRDKGRRRDGRRALAESWAAASGEGRKGRTLPPRGAGARCAGADQKEAPEGGRTSSKRGQRGEGREETRQDRPQAATG